MTSMPGHGTVPVDVAKLCALTWMCAAPPYGPNIHANDEGYQVIATAFKPLVAAAVKSPASRGDQRTGTA